MHPQTIDMQEAAQRTNIKGGARGLYALLKQRGQFNADNTPKQPLRQAGYFIVQFKQAYTNAGIPRNYSKTVVTPDGLLWLHQFVDRYGIKKPEPRAGKATGHIKPRPHKQEVRHAS